MKLLTLVLASLVLAWGCPSAVAGTPLPLEPLPGDSLLPGVAFTWPVEDAVAIQPYAACGWHGKAWRSYNAGIDCHTGVDIRPSWAQKLEYGAPVKAAADGTVARLVAYGKESFGMGNTVILRHANGRYSLYGHLDRFAPGLAPGMSVAQGDPLGFMGNSGVNARVSGTTHVHFEIKGSPVVLDTPGAPEYMGYTPGHPDLYGYSDPRTSVDGISEEAIDPLALMVVAPGPIEVRGSPGVVFLLAMATAVGEQLAPGQMVLSSRRAFVEGRYWYFAALPSIQPSPAKSGFPTRGPTGGWIDGDLVDTAAPPAKIRVESGFAVVRACARSSCAAIARIFKGQIFAAEESIAPRPGYRKTWYRIALPVGAGKPQGWACGAAVQVLAS